MNDAVTDPKTFLISLFNCAIAAADPMKVVPAFLPAKPKGRLIVIGAGKASARMAEAVESEYGPCSGIVITRYGYARPCKGIEIIEASHPVPDAVGEKATKKLLKLVSNLTVDDHVLALISGGGSALLCAPTKGISLANKMEINSKLLASGAPIAEMNTVRKRLSRVKGGKLAAACFPATLTSLLISDVPGDDLSVIASGPTVGDNSTKQEALQVLKDRDIEIGESVLTAIKNATKALAPTDPLFANVRNIIVAAPSQSLAAAAARAEQAGCKVEVLGDALEGEARELAQAHAQMAQLVQKNMQPNDSPILLLSGGECTVTRQGDGVGGPNAEYALAAAIALSGSAGIHLVAGDTDGVDGSAEVAGAYVGPNSLEKAKRICLSADFALSSNDAHSFFGRLDDQIITGPTLTNVNDFRAILVYPTIN